MATTPRPYESEPAEPYPGSAYYDPAAVPRDPFSGSYQGESRRVTVDLEVDLDEIREYSPALNIVSGTISDKGKSQRLWSGPSTAAYIRSPNDVSVGMSGGKYIVTTGVTVRLSDGGKMSGEFAGTFQKSGNAWKGKVKFTIDGKTAEFDVSRTSLFFRDVHLDIDYTEKVVWPVVELGNLPKPPAGMEKRKIDLFSVFEGAGVKLHYNPTEGDKVEDPTPENSWSRADVYNVMLDSFDEVKDADSNIWCMQGTAPPDPHTTGYFFDRNGKHGFALFLWDGTFKGYDDYDSKKKALANRRLLHYMARGCGESLGLKDSPSKNEISSLSWMNYGWMYDMAHSGESFYKLFEYQFTEQELTVLRHAPGKEFSAAAERPTYQSAYLSAYGSTAPLPDVNAADDSDDDGDDDAGGYGGKGYGGGGYGGKGYGGSGYGGKGYGGSGYGGSGYGGSGYGGSGYGGKGGKSYGGSGYGGSSYGGKGAKPDRKIELKLNVGKTSYKKGDLVDYEVRVKNVGKLPALVDGELSVESGNLQLYVTDPTGSVMPLESYAKPIRSPYNKTRVLYTAEDDEGPDRYSNTGTMGDSKNGYAFGKIGTYTVKARYSGGRYTVTSDAYSFQIEEPDTDDDYDAEAAAQVSELVQLGGSSNPRYGKANDYMVKVSKMPVEKKKSHVSAMIALFEGMSKPSASYTGYGGGAKGKKSRKLVETKPVREASYLLKDSDDLISYYHEKGEVADNQSYSKLVMTRASLYLKENKPQEAEAELNQMYGDLMGRKVKQGALAEIIKKWKKMRHPKPQEQKTTKDYYQARVYKVADWTPKKYGYGGKDISGLGLDRPFSSFNANHLKMADVVTKMLHNKHAETQDVTAVMKYANNLQRSREVNDALLKYSVESYVTHNKDARKTGIRIPEPPPLPPLPIPPAPPLPASAPPAKKPAIGIYNLKGLPGEKRMNYWRSDADFNYHHRHWHVVYSPQRRNDPHFKRGGEMFGYMHSQMLARYDAERETWGLSAVRAYEYGETVPAFSAGKKFHDAPINRYYDDREDAKLDKETVKEFCEWELAYNNAIKNEQKTANWAGQHLEASVYGTPYGNLHNMGHVALSGFVDDPIKGQSYMGSSVTAVRDPVFFRWHKRIDDLWQKNNDRIVTYLDKVKADVEISGKDIAITSSAKPRWQDGVETIKTFIRDPAKKFEVDGKIDHEPFYYHLKFAKGKPGTCVTIRIFICPERHANNRRSWIEMDKFVHVLKANSTLTRKDIESSVIRRTEEGYKGSAESAIATAVHGFCECGWPYTMLLPRGTLAGERYLLCVIATNSELDQVKKSTTCGSMSYCGAEDEEYPDKLQMGYPFTSKIHGVDKENSLCDVLAAQPNVALKTFVIQNQVGFKDVDPTAVAYKDPVPKVMSIWPTDEAKKKRMPLDGSYRASGWTGTFRTIVYAEDIKSNPAGSKVRIAFNGRGNGFGNYSVKKVQISARVEDTNKDDPSYRKTLTVQGQTAFTVPEEGLETDPVDFRLDNSKDYLVTFTIDSPGSYLRPNYIRTNSFILKGNDDQADESLWSGDVKANQNVYCISGIST